MRKILSLLIKTIIVSIGWSTVCIAEPTNDSTIHFKFGMLLPLSGNYSAIGTDTRQGIEIALSELNSRQISLVFGDSRTEPSHAINEFRKMVETDQVLAVFAFRGPIGMAVNPISKQQRIPLLGGVGNKDFVIDNNYSFQLWPPSDQEGKFIATHVADLHKNRIAVLTAQDDWTESVSAGFRSETKKLSINILLDQEFLPNELDFQSTIAKLKKSNPDIIFANLSLIQIGVFISKLRQFGIDVPIVSNFWINKPEVINAIGAKNLEGVKFAEMSNKHPKLESELKSRYDSKPSGANISAYVAMMFLGQASQQIKSKTSQEEFFNKLSEITKIKTANGDFIIENRIVKFPLVIRQFHNGVAYSVE